MLLFKTSSVFGAGRRRLPADERKPCLQEKVILQSEMLSNLLDNVNCLIIWTIYGCLRCFSAELPSEMSVLEIFERFAQGRFLEAERRCMSEKSVRAQYDEFSPDALNDDVAAGRLWS